MCAEKIPVFVLKVSLMFVLFAAFLAFAALSFNVFIINVEAYFTKKNKKTDQLLEFL